MDYEKLKEFRNTSPGFIRQIGLLITHIEDGAAEGRLVLTKDHSNPIGSIHGGLLFTVSDTVGGVTASSKGRMVTTVNASISYLRAGKVGDELIVKGKVVKSGKLLCVVQIDVYNQNNVQLTTSVITYHFLSKEMDVDELIKNLQE